MPRVRTHGLRIHDYTHENPLKRHPDLSRKDGAKGVAARAPSGAHIRTSVVVYTRVNRTTFRTEGPLKKEPPRARRIHSSSRRASSERHARVYRFTPKIMAPMAEKTFNIDVDRCASRVAISISISRLHPWMDLISRHRRSRSTDRAS